MDFKAEAVCLCVSRKRVERLMRERGLEARSKRRFQRTTDSNHTMPLAPNLLGGQFDAKPRTRRG